MTPTHHLKSWPEFFALSVNGLKPFEIRKNDRDFRLKDVVCLQEWDRRTQDYTGRYLHLQINYIIVSAPGLQEGYCILGLEGPFGLKRQEIQP